jgi:AcrR family transcriptional regulator
MKRKPTDVRQAEIVEAAMTVIAAKGAKRFTAQLIADEVGMTAGGLFRHFSSMDEIVEAVLDHMEGILFEGFPPSAADPWCRLRTFFEHRIQVIVDHPDISRILLLDPLSHLGGEKPAARVKALKRRSQGFVARCLQEAADGGTMASDVSVNAATVIVLGAVLAVGHATTSATDGKDTKRLTAEVWSVIEKMRHVPITDSQRQKEGHRR